jgi:hypothetical protein
MASENTVETIKLRMLTRNTYMTAFFFVYQVVKMPLQYKGYGAHFFHKTRFLPIPIFFISLWYSSIKLHQK